MRSGPWAAGLHYGYSQSWATWQFDADPEEMTDRLNGYLADPDRRRELAALPE